MTTAPTLPPTAATAAAVAVVATEATAAATSIDQPPVKDTPRWGKWTPEEEAYTSRLIADFTAGLLTDVDNGTTMRSWLSTKLRCCPMRISKKFVGEQSIGKRMFERNESRLVDMSAADAATRKADLDALQAAFNESWVREEREREEHKANGTRKRKRNRSKKAAKATTNAAAATASTLLRHSATSSLNKKPSPTGLSLPVLQAKATAATAQSIAASVQSAAASLNFLHKHAAIKTQPPSRRPLSAVKKVAVPSKKHQATTNPHTCSPKRRKGSPPTIKPDLSVAATPLDVTASFADSAKATSPMDAVDAALDLGSGDFDYSFDFLDSDDTIDSLWLLDDCSAYDGSFVGGKAKDTDLNSPTSVADPNSWLHLMGNGGLTFDNLSAAQLYDSLFDPCMSCR